MIQNNGFNKFSDPSEALLTGVLGSTRAKLFQIHFNTNTSQIKIPGPIENFCVLNSFVPFSYGGVVNNLVGRAFIYQNKILNSAFDPTGGAINNNNGIVASEIVPVLGGMFATWPSDDLFVKITTPIIPFGDFTNVTTYLPQASDTLNILTGVNSEFQHNNNFEKSFKISYSIDVPSSAGAEFIGFYTGAQTRLKRIQIEILDCVQKVTLSISDASIQDGLVFEQDIFNFEYNILQTRQKISWNIPDTGSPVQVLTINAGGPGETGLINYTAEFAPRD